jgi:tetratricopeptide (TPR) repeat protein
LPDDPAAYRLLGYFYLARGENAKALAEFESLCTEHPRDLDSREERVQLLILNHRVEDAAGLNNKILKESPHDAVALILSAQIDIQLKRYDEAIRSLQQAMTSATAGSSAHYYLGLVYQQRSDPKCREPKVNGKRLYNYSRVWSKLGKHSPRSPSKAETGVGWRRIAFRSRKQVSVLILFCPKGQLVRC